MKALLFLLLLSHPVMAQTPSVHFVCNEELCYTTRAEFHTMLKILEEAEKRLMKCGMI